jgi:sulfite reductase beta subunit-like hemoprotein
MPPFSIAQEQYRYHRLSAGAPSHPASVRPIGHVATCDERASLTMAWSGCPAGCDNHHVGDIGLQGSKTRVDGKVINTVTIFAGGDPSRGHAWLR